MKSEGCLRFVVTKVQDKPGKEKEERRYEFLAPLGSPFGEIHDALYEFLEEVLKMAKSRSEELQRQRKQDDSKKVKEEPKKDGVPN